MKNKILSLIVVSTFLFSTVAFAQTGEKTERGDRGSKMSPERKEMMMKKRQSMKKGDRPNFFTEEQREAMKALRLETVKQVKPIKNQLQELAAHQNTLTTADKADLKAINSNIDKMSELKTKIAKIMAAQHQEVRALLTEEQLLKFDAMKGKHGKRDRGDVKKRRAQRGGHAESGRRA